MKKILCTFLAQILFCALIFGGGIVPPRQNPNKPEWVKGEILVKFVDDIDLQISSSKGIIKTGIISIDDLAQKWKISHIEKVFKNEIKRLEIETIITYTGEIIEVPQLFNIYKLKFSKKTNVKDIIVDFEKNPNVVYAEPNYIARMCVIPNDTSFSNQWGLHNTGQYHLIDADIDAPEAWDIETGDSTVIIGILDTGVDYGHPDLADNVISAGYDFVNNDNDAMDDNGHGSHVAGIAAAATNNTTGIAGVAWNCRILPVKVLQSNGYGTYSDVASGVNYAANNGAKVINLSLGGYASSYVLQNALENAYTTSVIVAAAGNGGTSAPFYPAAWSFIIGAGASDVLYDPITQTWYEAKAVFSNYGINADLYAPGVNIFSTIPLYHPHTYSYTSWNGTSMAAPFVTGVVALLRSHYSDWSNELIHGQLVYSSDVITGGIRLNAYKSLTEIAIPQLNLYSHSITDTLAGCDQDGIADAGETVEMVFDIQNTWGQAYNVEAKLSYHSHEDTCFVTIIDSVSTFGGLSSYAHVNNESNPFVFFVKNSAPNNTDVYFDYEITCDTGHIFTGTYYITTERGIEIGGIISSNTTLTNDYLYIVTNNTLVDTGVILTIEPDTRLQFYKDTYLRIDGTLIAIGNEDSLIVFSSNEQVPSPGDWYGIRYTNPSINAVLDSSGNYLSGSILKYCRIEYGRGVSAYQAYPLIVNNEFIKNSSMSVYPNSESGGALLIVQKNCEDGIMNVENNYFDSNSGGIGIDVRIDNTIVSIYENELISNGSSGRGTINIWGGTAEQVKIVRNKIISGTGYGFYLNNSPLISFNQIIGNHGGIYIYSGSPIFRNNNIAHNTHNGGYPGNNSHAGSGVKTFSGCSANFVNNNIMSNIGDPAIFAGRGYYGIIDSNNIFNEGTPFDIYVNTTSTNNFDAKYNYWNTSDTLIVEDRIWHRWDDFDIAEVYYKPILDVPNTAAPGFLYQMEINPPSPIGCEVDTINLTFSKPMDISVQPIVSFGVCEPYTQHIVEGSWVDSTNWQGDFTFGIMTGDGINYLRVTTAEDCDGMEIPKDTRFSFVVDATGASSVGFVAQAGIGKVDLSWHTQDLSNLMGYNMYRCNNITDTTYSDTTLINTEMITDTAYCDMTVIPNVTYYYLYKGISTDFIESDYSDPASATPFNAPIGDANGDLSVDVLDITTIVSYMLNQNPQPFLFDAADVNYDNDINVLDIIGLVQLINGGKSLSVKPLPEISNEKAYYSIKDNLMQFESEGNVLALQFKIRNLKLETRNLKQVKISSLLEGFEFAYCLADDYIIGILYSMTGELIPNGLSTLFRFEGVDFGEIEITQIFGGDLSGDYVPVLKKGLNSVDFASDAELQACPNPFTYLTQINYIVPENGIVEIRIFNMNGAVITLMQNRFQNAGRHTINWNGTNDKGQLLKSGIYLIQLRIKSVSGNSYNKEIKVVLTK